MARKIYEGYCNKEKGSDLKDDGIFQDCSAIATRSLVQKKEDPSAFTNQCIIGLLHFSNALCDIGARINLMSLSIYKKLGLGDPKLNLMRLLIADITVKRSIGFVYDVLRVVHDRLPHSKNFYPRPSFPDIQFEENNMHPQSVADAKQFLKDAEVSLKAKEIATSDSEDEENNSSDQSAPSSPNCIEDGANCNCIVEGLIPTKYL
ncbi:uncharacterized protein LOC107019448 [Solanum pennellii]|uniref:Uncharacterized protein LOC107019448 n=1 Tax=Solanum pennellii TaxID=28526 RepID=A0ABM1GST8_SOLPN|nr:uncharacterized protein LOC107019448 [Solanum pennellii]